MLLLSCPMDQNLGIFHDTRMGKSWAGGKFLSFNTSQLTRGEYENPNAHSGLRLLNDEQRSFYRLAVEQVAVDAR